MRRVAIPRMIMLAGIYAGAIYGGSRSAILLNIPGTPANAATALDGHPLALSGRAGYAMGIATSSSAIGTLIGILFLAVSAPLLSANGLPGKSVTCQATNSPARSRSMKRFLS